MTGLELAEALKCSASGRSRPSSPERLHRPFRVDVQRSQRREYQRRETRSFDTPATSVARLVNPTRCHYCDNQKDNGVITWGTSVGPKCEYANPRCQSAAAFKALGSHATARIVDLPTRRLL